MSDILNTYPKELDNISLSAEQKNALTARLEQSLESYATYSTESTHTENIADKKADTTAKSTAHARKTTATLLLAALLTFVGGTAYAVTHGYVSVPETISRFFNGETTPVPTEVVNKIGKPVGASASDNGVTITADTIVGDADNYMVTYSIVKDDGTPFEGIENLLLPNHLSKSQKNVKDDFLIFREENGIDAFHEETATGFFYDVDPDDPAVQYVTTHEKIATINNPTTPMGNTHTITFHDLTISSYNENSEKSADDIIIKHILAEGEWTLSFTVNYEDTTIHVPTHDKEMVLPFIDSQPLILTQLKVSPLGFSVTTKDIPDGEREKIDVVLQDTDMVFHYADGTTTSRDINTMGMALYEEDGAHMVTSSGFFSTVVPLDDVVSISIGDTNFPIQ